MNTYTKCFMNHKIMETMALYEKKSINSYNIINQGIINFYLKIILSA